MFFKKYMEWWEEWPPLLRDRKVRLVAHEEADPSCLPFPVEGFYPVTTNQWVDHKSHLTRIMPVAEQGVGDVWLFAAGPYSCIAIYKIWKIAKNNSYIDVGSILDPALGLGKTRTYLRDILGED
jgi:hypothetical protein